MASPTEFFTEFKTHYNICASVCCICHKTLTDPSSIEYGIGPVCRKNGNYDDAPSLSNDQIGPLEEAIDAAFPQELASYLLNKIKVDSPGGNPHSPPFLANLFSKKVTRQIAKCTVYYASSLIGTFDEGRMIHCIRVLIIMGYSQLAQRLLSKSYGHLVWKEGEPPKMFYKGPYNALINCYLKSQFMGVWDKKHHHWVIQGSLLDCMAMLIAAELGDLKPVPSTPPKKTIPIKIKEPSTPPKKKIPIKTKEPSTPTLEKSESKASMISTPEKNKVQIKLTLTGQTVSVNSPFNYQFKNQVKTLLEGQWDPIGKQWKVDVKHLEILKKIIVENYPESTTVLTF